MPDKIIEKIVELKEKRNAVILVHNYQPGELQDIADFLGDSLDLSQKARDSKKDVIVFCGVHFMAETASILCPDKTVLLPEITSGCPMANMVTADKLKAMKKDYPGVPVVCYINTTAEVKAESDVCCTSSNAVKIAKSIDSNKIIFVPDKNLGHYVSTQVDKEFILWEGYCPIHINIIEEYVLKAKKEHPKAEVIVHPECPPDVVKIADVVLSTSGMCNYVRESKKTEFIIGTETGIIYRMKKENPGKSFYPATDLAVCPNMKKNSLEKLLWALEDMKYKIEVPKETREKAKKCIDAMFKINSV
ncbi:MAG: quinolinate synthase NadA [Elusimicrobia bacterium]|nr:quinolinate synthase NadA [Candidatus Liberimonas magnetica]